MSRHDHRGFTLIELLVVVVIIGIVAAIAIPSLLNAIDRGKQKRTMANIKSLATAVEAYSVDHNIYPNTSTWSDMAAEIEGEYMQKIQEQDGWGWAMIYSSNAAAYTIGSVGKDGGATLSVDGTGGPKNGFALDIIYSNGSFVQWPEGEQSD